ncbi:MAG: AraC family transcriptional regulator ligand-binding domain-containing protein [Cellvibrionaceae bacterium]
MNAYFCIDDKVQATTQLPAAILALAKNHRLDFDALVRGTGIFDTDLSDCRHRLSSRKWHRLLQNVEAADRSQELLFRLGRRLPYIAHGALLQALLNCASARELLEILRDHSRLYYPSCFFQLASTTHHHIFLINDAIGHGEQQYLHDQVVLSSIITLFKACNISTEGISYLLSQSRPQDTAAHSTYLSSRIHYCSPVTALIIPDNCGVHEDASGHSEFSNNAKLSALQQCDMAQMQDKLQPGFIEAVQKHLMRQLLREDVCLNSCAQAFNTSPASLKRWLKNHHSSFQQQLDNARKILALSMIFIDELSNDETARRLRIHDRANFRRSFKRWTGTLPSKLREDLLHF